MVEYISKPKYDLSSLHKKKIKNHERVNSITQNKALDNILFKVSVNNNKKKWRKRIPLSQPPPEIPKKPLVSFTKAKNWTIEKQNKIQLCFSP